MIGFGDGGHDIMVIGDVISGFRGSGLRYKVECVNKEIIIEFNQKNIMSTIRTSSCF